MKLKSAQALTHFSVDPSVALGRAVAEARRGCQLTQQQLCEQAGIAYSTLTKIERGAIKKPNVFTIYKIAQLTNLKVEDFLQSSILKENSVLKDDLSLRQTVTKPFKNTLATPTREFKTNIRFVYFDVHQVLVNSSRGAFTNLMAATNSSLSKIENLFSRYNNDLCRGQLKTSEMNKIVDQATGATGVNWLEYYTQSIVPNNEIQTICRQIMERYPVGLLTNAWSGNIKILMRKNLIPDGFIEIVDSSAIGYIKPEKEIYKQAQKQARVRPQEILLIDDRYINIVAAKNCGWQGLLVDHRSRPNFFEKLQALLNF